MSQTVNYTVNQRQKAIALYMGVYAHQYRFLFWKLKLHTVLGDALSIYGFKTEQKAWDAFLARAPYFQWENLMPAVVAIESFSGKIFYIEDWKAKHQTVEHTAKNKKDAIFMVASDYCIDYCNRGTKNFLS